MQHWGQQDGSKGKVLATQLDGQVKFLGYTRWKERVTSTRCPLTTHALQNTCACTHNFFLRKKDVTLLQYFGGKSHKNKIRVGEG